MRAFIVVLLIAAGLGGYIFREDLPFLHPGEAAASADDPASHRRGGKGGEAAPVVTAVAEAGALPVRRATIGTIVAAASTPLVTSVPGIATEVRAASGSRVAKGDVLVMLDDRAAQADLARDEAALARDRATLKSADATLQRTQGLVTRGLDTAQAGEDARAALAVAEADVTASEAGVNADRVAISLLTLRAPFAGRLGAVDITTGSYLAPSAPYATLTQLDPVLAEFALPETDLGDLRRAIAAGEATARVASSDGGRGADRTGPIDFLDNAVDHASGTIRMRARLDNRDRAFWPGQAISVTVTMGEVSGLAIVPDVAVAPDEGAPDAADGGASRSGTVYVIADGKAQARPVTVALREGDRAGISDGLEPGEAVIVEGRAGLSDGAPVRIVPAGGKAANGGGRQGRGRQGARAAGRGRRR